MRINSVIYENRTKTYINETYRKGLFQHKDLQIFFLLNLLVLNPNRFSYNRAKKIKHPTLYLNLNIEHSLGK